MAKKKDSPCMFCGELPCVCDGPARTPKKRAPKKVADVAPPIRTEPSEPIDFNDMQPVAQSRFSVKTDERDWALESAAFTLLHMDIVSPEDKKILEEILARPISSDLEKRLIDWRERHVGRTDARDSSSA